MTWATFKEKIEKCGIADDSEISWLGRDEGTMTIQIGPAPPGVPIIMMEVDVPV